jgi:hypothetical protein
VRRKEGGREGGRGVGYIDAWRLRNEEGYEMGRKRM